MNAYKYMFAAIAAFHLGAVIGLETEFLSAILGMILAIWQLTE